MKLYVMRHGPAEDDAASGRDADRALTHSGRERTREVARALVANEEAPLAIVSSPLVRALQTAEIVAAVTELDKRGAAVEVRREMGPGGDALGLVAELLRTGRKRVMVVGHEPDVSLLVHSLTGASPEAGLSKSMVVGVRVDPEASGARASDLSAKLRFVLEPKSLAWQRA